MNQVFADTSFFVAYLNGRDVKHRLAVELFDYFGGKIWITYWILTELGNYYCRSPVRASLASVIADFLTDSRVLLTPVTEVEFSRGLALYGRRPDKQWSLTDCISLLVMEENGIRDAWTTDHHFEQAGFNVLLK